MIEFKDEVLEEGVVVHCDRGWEASNLLEWAHSKGIKWSGGDSLLVGSRYEWHEEHTCYNILEEGCLYTHLGFYKNEGYKILTYEEALKEEEVEMKRGVRVYVSNISVEDALQNKNARIFLTDVGGNLPIITVYSYDNDCFPGGNYDTRKWKYATPIPTEKEELPELTMKEVSEKLGYDFKLIKED